MMSQSIFWKTLPRTPPTTQHTAVSCCHRLKSNQNSAVQWCTPTEANHFDKDSRQFNSKDDNLRHGRASDDNFSPNVLHLSSRDGWVKLRTFDNYSRDWCGWWTSGFPWISSHWTSHTCTFGRPGLSEVWFWPCQSSLFYRLPKPASGSKWRGFSVLHSLLPFRPLPWPRFQHCGKLRKPAWGI